MTIRPDNYDKSWCFCNFLYNHDNCHNNYIYTIYIYIQLIRTITFWIGSSWLLDNILQASAPALAHEKWTSSSCFRGLEKCSSHTLELFAWIKIIQNSHEPWSILTIWLMVIPSIIRILLFSKMFQLYKFHSELDQRPYNFPLCSHQFKLGNCGCSQAIGSIRM